MSEREAIVALIEIFAIVSVSACLVGALVMAGRLLWLLRSEHMKGSDDGI